jgi:hypothetical protein
MLGRLMASILSNATMCWHQPCGDNVVDDDLGVSIVANSDPRGGS